MTAREISEEELDIALGRLSDPEVLRGAQDLVMRATPRLQRVLADALEHGGWFGSGHEQAIHEAVASSDPETRLQDARTLVAEETRLAMFVGVAVGIGLAQQLGLAAEADEPHP